MCESITLVYKLCFYIQINSNRIKFICDTKQNINECDIIIRQMCRQDTKAVPTALAGALESKNKWKTQITTVNEDRTNWTKRTDCLYEFIMPSDTGHIECHLCLYYWSMLMSDATQYVRHWWWYGKYLQISSLPLAADYLPPLGFKPGDVTTVLPSLPYTCTKQSIKCHETVQLLSCK